MEPRTDKISQTPPPPENLTLAKPFSLQNLFEAVKQILRRLVHSIFPKIEFIDDVHTPIFANMNITVPQFSPPDPSEKKSGTFPSISLMVSSLVSAEMKNIMGAIARLSFDAEDAIACDTHAKQNPDVVEAIAANSSWKKSAPVSLKDVLERKGLFAQAAAKLNVEPQTLEQRYLETKILLMNAARDNNIEKFMTGMQNIFDFISSPAIRKEALEFLGVDKVPLLAHSRFLLDEMLESPKAFEELFKALLQPHYAEKYFAPAVRNCGVEAREKEEIYRTPSLM